jgi:ADP-heptose:LPS heptosyltransferase
MSNQQHILVIRLSSMGDVAMTVPVLQLLLNQHPDIRLTIVSRPKFEAFFRHLPRTAFFSADVDAKYRGIFGIFKLAGQLRLLKPNAVADLHEVLRSNLLKSLLKILLFIPVKTIQKGRADKKRLCANNPKKELKPIKNSFERYADVFEKLGYKIDLEVKSEFLKPALSIKAEHLLSEAGDNIAIGIAPFARYQGKTYPIESMKIVLQQLLEAKPELHLFLFAAITDQENLQKIKDLNPDKITLIAGTLDLYEELGLISRLKLMLSMDSANMHIASMLGVRVISLWGATHPYLGFYGWKQNIEDAICADRNKFPNLPSSVNGSKQHPGTEHCMETIEPKTIVQKMLENL